MTGDFNMARDVRGAIGVGAASPVRSFWDALRPHASGAGSYVNFMTDVEEDRVKASYGADKYARQARVKRQWDPDNVFHLNVNIKPG